MLKVDGGPPPHGIMGWLATKGGPTVMKKNRTKHPPRNSEFASGRSGLHEETHPSRGTREDGKIPPRPRDQFRTRDLPGPPRRGPSDAVRPETPAPGGSPGRPARNHGGPPRLRRSEDSPHEAACSKHPGSRDGTADLERL